MDIYEQMVGGDRKNITYAEDSGKMGLSQYVCMSIIMLHLPFFIQPF